MEALKIYTRAENGKIMVAIPKEMQNQSLEVVVKPALTNFELGDKEWDQHLQMVKQRGESMRKLYGTAPFPDFKMDEDEWYNQ